MNLKALTIIMKYRYILFAFIIKMFFAQHALSQTIDEYIKYLKNNSVSIKDTTENWNVVLDSSFYSNNFFWIGEAHGIKYSYDALWILLKQIHKNTGFKYFLLENGYITELYIKKYMETGDENYLIKNFNALNGTPCCNKSAFNFYRKLYDYNQRLPKNDRIELISIDIELQYKETDKYIRRVLVQNQTSLDSADFIYEFIHSSEDYKNLYAQLAHDIKQDSIKYKALLNNDYNDFKYMVRNINYLFIARKSGNWRETRDSLMFENYKTRLHNHDFISSKTFAFFGKSHCYLNKTKNYTTIASLINDSKSEIKSTSIVLLYSKCESMKPIWKKSQDIPKSQKINDNYFKASYDDDLKNVYKKAIKESFSLINIWDTKVSFWTARFSQYGIDSDSSLNDYFDYFLLIKNSPATEPYYK
jgi:hypothetical protein